MHRLSQRHLWKKIQVRICLNYFNAWNSLIVCFFIIFVTYFPKVWYQKKVFLLNYAIVLDIVFDDIQEFTHVSLIEATKSLKYLKSSILFSSFFINWNCFFWCYWSELIVSSFNEHCCTPLEIIGKRIPKKIFTIMAYYSHHFFKFHPKKPPK